MATTISRQLPIEVARADIDTTLDTNWLIKQKTEILSELYRLKKTNTSDITIEEIIEENVDKSKTVKFKGAKMQVRPKHLQIAAAPPVPPNRRYIMTTAINFREAQRLQQEVYKQLEEINLNIVKRVSDRKNLLEMNAQFDAQFDMATKMIGEYLVFSATVYLAGVYVFPYIMQGLAANASAISTAQVAVEEAKKTLETAKTAVEGLLHNEVGQIPFPEDLLGFAREIIDKPTPELEEALSKFNDASQLVKSSESALEGILSSNGWLKFGVNFVSETFLGLDPIQTQKMIGLVENMQVQMLELMKDPTFRNNPSRIMDMAFNGKNPLNPTNPLGTSDYKQHDLFGKETAETNINLLPFQQSVLALTNQMIIFAVGPLAAKYMITDPNTLALPNIGQFAESIKKGFENGAISQSLLDALEYIGINKNSNTAFILKNLNSVFGGALAVKKNWDKVFVFLNHMKIVYDKVNAVFQPPEQIDPSLQEGYIEKLIKRTKNSTVLRKAFKDNIIKFFSKKSNKFKWLRDKYGDIETRLLGALGHHDDEDDKEVDKAAEKGTLNGVLENPQIAKALLGLANGQTNEKIIEALSAAADDDKDEKESAKYLLEVAKASKGKPPKEMVSDMLAAAMADTNGVVRAGFGAVKTDATGLSVWSAMVSASGDENMDSYSNAAISAAHIANSGSATDAANAARIAVKTKYTPPATQFVDSFLDNPVIKAAVAAANANPTDSTKVVAAVEGVVNGTDYAEAVLAAKITSSAYPKNSALVVAQVANAIRMNDEKRQEPQSFAQKTSARIKGNIYFFYGSITPENCIGYATDTLFNMTAERLTGKLRSVNPGLFSSKQNKSADKEKKEREEYEKSIEDMRMAYIKQGKKGDELVNLMREAKMMSDPCGTIDHRNLNALEYSFKVLQKKTKELHKAGVFTGPLLLWGTTTIAQLAGEIITYRNKPSVEGSAFHLDWAAYTTPLINMYLTKTEDQTWLDAVSGMMTITSPQQPVAIKMSQLLSRLNTELSTIYQDVYEKYIRGPLFNTPVIQWFLNKQNKIKKSYRDALRRFYLSTYITYALDMVIDTLFGFLIELQTNMPNQALTYLTMSINQQLDIHSYMRPEGWNWILENLSGKSIMSFYAYSSKTVAKKGWLGAANQLRGFLSWSPDELGLPYEIEMTQGWGSKEQARGLTPAYLTHTEAYDDTALKEARRKYDEKLAELRKTNPTLDAQILAETRAKYDLARQAYAAAKAAASAGKAASGIVAPDVAEKEAERLYLEAKKAKEELEAAIRDNKTKLPVELAMLQLEVLKLEEAEALNNLEEAKQRHMMFGERTLLDIAYSFLSPFIGMRLYASRVRLMIGGGLSIVIEGREAQAFHREHQANDFIAAAAEELYITKKELSEEYIRNLAGNMGLDMKYLPSLADLNTRIQQHIDRIRQILAPNTDPSVVQESCRRLRLADADALSNKYSKGKVPTKEEHLPAKFIKIDGVVYKVVINGEAPQDDPTKPYAKKLHDLFNLSLLPAGDGDDSYPSTPEEKVADHLDDKGKPKKGYSTANPLETDTLENAALSLIADLFQGRKGFGKNERDSSSFLLFTLPNYMFGAGSLFFNSILSSEEYKERLDAEQALSILNPGLEKDSELYKKLKAELQRNPVFLQQIAKLVSIPEALDKNEKAKNAKIESWVDGPTRKLVQAEKDKKRECDDFNKIKTSTEREAMEEAIKSGLGSSGYTIELNKTTAPNQYKYAAYHELKARCELFTQNVDKLNAALTKGRADKERYEEQMRNLENGGYLLDTEMIPYYNAQRDLNRQREAAFDATLNSLPKHLRDDLNVNKNKTIDKYLAKISSAKFIANQLIAAISQITPCDKDSLNNNDTFKQFNTLFGDPVNQGKDMSDFQTIRDKLNADCLSQESLNAKKRDIKGRIEYMNALRLKLEAAKRSEHSLLDMTGYFYEADAYLSNIRKIENDVNRAQSASDLYAEGFGNLENETNRLKKAVAKHLKEKITLDRETNKGKASSIKEHLNKEFDDHKKEYRTNAAQAAENKAKELNATIQEMIASSNDDLEQGAGETDDAYLSRLRDMPDPSVTEIQLEVLTFLSGLEGIVGIRNLLENANAVLLPTEIDKSKNPSLLQASLKGEESMKPFLDVNTEKRTKYGELEYRQSVLDGKRLTILEAAAALKTLSETKAAGLETEIATAKTNLTRLIRTYLESRNKLDIDINEYNREFDAALKNAKKSRKERNEKELDILSDNIEKALGGVHTEKDAMEWYTSPLQDELTRVNNLLNSIFAGIGQTDEQRSRLIARRNAIDGALLEQNRLRGLLADERKANAEELLESVTISILKLQGLMANYDKIYGGDEARQKEDTEALKALNEEFGRKYQVAKQKLRGLNEGRKAAKQGEANRILAKYELLYGKPIKTDDTDVRSKVIFLEGIRDGTVLTDYDYAFEIYEGTNVLDDLEKLHRLLGQIAYIESGIQNPTANDIGLDNQLKEADVFVSNNLAKHYSGVATSAASSAKSNNDDIKKIKEKAIPPYSVISIEADISLVKIYAKSARSAAGEARNAAGLARAAATAAGTADAKVSAEAAESAATQAESDATAAEAGLAALERILANLKGETLAKALKEAKNQRIAAEKYKTAADAAKSEAYAAKTGPAASAAASKAWTAHVKAEAHATEAERWATEAETVVGKEAAAAVRDEATKARKAANEAFNAATEANKKRDERIEKNAKISEANRIIMESNELKRRVREAYNKIPSYLEQNISAAKEQLENIRRELEAAQTLQRQANALTGEGENVVSANGRAVDAARGAVETAEINIYNIQEYLAKVKILQLKEERDANKVKLSTLRVSTYIKTNEQLKQWLNDATRLSGLITEAETQMEVLKNGFELIILPSSVQPAAGDDVSAINEAARAEMRRRIYANHHVFYTELYDPLSLLDGGKYKQNTQVQAFKTTVDENNFSKDLTKSLDELITADDIITDIRFHGMPDLLSEFERIKLLGEVKGKADRLVKKIRRLYKAIADEMHQAHGQVKEAERIAKICPTTGAKERARIARAAYDRLRAKLRGLNLLKSTVKGIREGLTDDTTVDKLNAESLFLDQLEGQVDANAEEGELDDIRDNNKKNLDLYEGVSKVLEDQLKAFKQEKERADAALKAKKEYDDCVTTHMLGSYRCTNITDDQKEYVRDYFINGVPNDMYKRLEAEISKFKSWKAKFNDLKSNPEDWDEEMRDYIEGASNRVESTLLLTEHERQIALAILNTYIGKIEQSLGTLESGLNAMTDKLSDAYKQLEQQVNSLKAKIAELDALKNKLANKDALSNRELDLLKMLLSLQADKNPEEHDEGNLAVEIWQQKVAPLLDRFGRLHEQGKVAADVYNMNFLKRNADGIVKKEDAKKGFHIEFLLDSYRETNPNEDITPIRDCLNNDASACAKADGTPIVGYGPLFADYKSGKCKREADLLVEQLFGTDNELALGNQLELAGPNNIVGRIQVLLSNPEKNMNILNAAAWRTADNMEALGGKLMAYGFAAIEVGVVGLSVVLGSTGLGLLAAGVIAGVYIVGEYTGFNNWVVEQVTQIATHGKQLLKSAAGAVVAYSVWAATTAITEGVIVLGESGALVMQLLTHFAAEGQFLHAALLGGAWLYTGAEAMYASLAASASQVGTALSAAATATGFVAAGAVLIGGMKALLAGLGLTVAAHGIKEGVRIDAEREGEDVHHFMARAGQAAKDVHKYFLNMFKRGNKPMKELGLGLDAAFNKSNLLFRIDIHKRLSELTSEQDLADFKDIKELLKIENGIDAMPKSWWKKLSASQISLVLSLLDRPIEETQSGGATEDEFKIYLETVFNRLILSYLPLVSHGFSIETVRNLVKNHFVYGVLYDIIRRKNIVNAKAINIVTVIFTPYARPIQEDDDTFVTKIFSIGFNTFKIRLRNNAPRIIKIDKVAKAEEELLRQRQIRQEQKREEKEILMLKKRTTQEFELLVAQEEEALFLFIEAAFEVTVRKIIYDICVEVEFKRCDAKEEDWRVSIEEGAIYNTELTRICEETDMKYFEKLSLENRHNPTKLVNQFRKKRNEYGKNMLSVVSAKGAWVKTFKEKVKAEFLDKKQGLLWYGNPNPEIENIIYRTQKEVKKLMGDVNYKTHTIRVRGGFTEKIKRHKRINTRKQRLSSIDYDNAHDVPYQPL
jgi:hypothetical protein